MSAAQASSESLQDPWATMRKEGTNDLMWAFTCPFNEQGVDKLKLQNGMKILDIAAGTGSIAIPLALQLKEQQVQAAIHATDISPGLLDSLKENIASCGLASDAIQVSAMDALALDLPDSSIDIVTCGFAMMLMPDKARVVSEVSRVLKPRGQLMYTVWQQVGSAGVLRVLDAPTAKVDAFEADMFALSDPEANCSLLQDDFTSVECTVVEHSHTEELLVKSAPMLIKNPVLGPLFAKFKDGTGVQRIVDAFVDPANKHLQRASALVVRALRKG